MSEINPHQYDQWLMKPYLDEYGHDDVPGYDTYLQDQLDDQVDDYQEYVEDAKANGEVILSFTLWVEKWGQTPMPLEDWIEEKQQEAYEQSQYMKGYDF